MTKTIAPADPREEEGGDGDTLARRLSELLGLEHPPVALGLRPDAPAPDARRPGAPQPAGCCFWAQAETVPLVTDAADHAGCSVGSYTHGFIELAEAADAADVGALVASGWVAPSDLATVPAVSARPETIVYGPFEQAELADVVLVRLDPRMLVTLQGACPETVLTGKPQCQIVPRALAGEVVVSPGCAVSRIRTGLPAGELTCALPAEQLPAIVVRLEASANADHAAAAFAAADIESYYPGRNEHP